MKAKANKTWTVGELIEALGMYDKNKMIELEVSDTVTFEFQIGIGRDCRVELGDFVIDDG